MTHTINRHRRPVPQQAPRVAHRRLAVVVGAVAALAALVIGGILLASTGKRPATGAVSGAAQATAPVVAASPRPPDAPPLPHDFSIQTTSWSGGQTFVLSQQWGRPVVVYFMASWCLTCIPETRALATLYEKYRDTGLQVLIVDVDPGSTEAQLLDFKKAAKGADHLWALDKKNELVRLFDVRTLDTTIIFDKEGNIAYRSAFPLSLQTLEEVVRKYL